MAKRNKKFLIIYKFRSAMAPGSEVVCAEDAACALGLFLDSLDDADVEFEYLTLRSEARRPTAAQQPSSSDGADLSQATK